MDVVRDCDLTTNEKRGLLASWASDAYAVAASPGLRQLPDSSPIPIDDILTALKRWTATPWNGQSIANSSIERTASNRYSGRIIKVGRCFPLRRR